MIYDSMNDVIGGTPLVRLRVDAPEGVEVYAKLELANPFAMKDRVARQIILSAREQGVLRPRDPIVESSSGTMALGVALVGRSLGHEVHIVTDPRIDPVTRAKLRSMGCTLHVVTTMTDRGWQGARLDRLDQLIRELPGAAFWPQQYSNPDNPRAYRALAEELIDDLGRVDVLVGSVGSGGSLCGSARALRRSQPGLWVVGVDSVGSVLFDQPDRPGRLQGGLGNSLLPKNVDRRVVDEIHWLNDREAFEATGALALEQQIFGGNTSGSVYRVLGEVASHAQPGTRIVGIFPDRGDRYAETVHSPAYWAEQALSTQPLSRCPDAVDYGSPVHSWSRAVVKHAPNSPQHLLFIESNTTGTGMIALRRTFELGLRPVLLTGSPERYSGLAETGCAILPCDTNSTPALRTAIQDGFRREEIAGVTTTSDFYVPTVAETADWLGLPGNRADAMTTCRNKALMRAALATAGVPQPRFAVVTEVAQVADAVAAVGLPCVVKPADDSASQNVLLCADEQQVRAHAELVLGIHTNVRGMPTARTVLVEEFVDAPEFSVEMFSHLGAAECVGITAKEVGGAPYFVERGHVFPAPLPTERADELVAVVRAALTACGVETGPTHTEVRLTADGPVIIEINPRLAGGMIPELVRLSTGIDLLEQQLKVAAGQPPLLAPTHHTTAGIRFLLADREGVLTEIHGLAEATATEGVEQVRVTPEPGTRVRPATSAYDRLGHIIATGPDPTSVRTTLNTATTTINLRITTP
ncbi:pyridoxal-phosphate dependent enzyme [Streptomyces sp. NBRC 109706]|uniref:pyridoxal-phosphate dependent enzyme n=1 Tax=Streptomyces sp. NBRC 109706 TaxID=1550035 RepID=UPI0007830A0A|nr:pyridoxal-phosphate dependent enzyme [Streptomyces sp. NBRC 109706]